MESSKKKLDEIYATFIQNIIEVANRNGDQERARRLKREYEFLRSLESLLKKEDI